MTQMHSGGVNARAILFFLALGVAAPVGAQTETEPRVWTAVSMQGRMGDDSPWRWSADSLVRTRNGAGTMDFAAEWVTVSRDLTRRSSVGIGYAYAAGFPDAGSVREHRFVQDYSWSAGTVWRVSFRSRLEERFVTGHDAMLIRMRQQVRATWPLAGSGTLRGVVSEELFVRASPGTSRGIDSNRAFVGIARTVTPRSRVEAGYMNVYTPGASSGTRRSHVISATLVLSM